MQLPEGGVGAFAGQQFLVGARFGNAALVHIDDAVGPGRQIEVVGDHQRGAVLDQAFDGVAHHGLAGAVQPGGGLIQHHDRAVPQGQPGNGQSLALAARQGGTAFADDGVVAFGQGHDEIVCVGHFCSGDDFLVAHLAAGRAGQVVAHAGGKQQRVLRQQADLATYRGGLPVADVGAIDFHAAFLRVVQAQQQYGERGFADARRPHHRHVFARGQCQIEPMENGT